MKKYILLLSLIMSISGFADKRVKTNPVRKALVTCDFKTLGIEDFDTRLSYLINLDEKKVIVRNFSDNGLLDGDVREHERTTTHAADESFLFIVEDNTGYVNLSPVNIQGGNGDDMDMFTRISFTWGAKREVVGTAVLIYADEGNDGYVSRATPCTVEPQNQ